MILTACTLTRQARLVEPATTAAHFKLTGITTATRGQVELTLTNAQGKLASVAVSPGFLGSYAGLQRLLLKHGVVLRDARFERGRGRFHSWRKLVDRLLVDGNTMETTA